MGIDIQKEIGREDKPLTRADVERILREVVVISAKSRSYTHLVKPAELHSPLQSSSRLAPFIHPWARVTTRLLQAVEDSGLATSGMPGAR
jgi:hypothetical protein